MGLTAGLDAVAKRRNPFPAPEENRTPIAQPVTQSQLSYSGSTQTQERSCKLTFAI